MVSRPIEALLLEDPIDDDPIPKSQHVKRILRSTYVEGDNVVSNIMHVPDIEEIGSIYPIIFKYSEADYES
jgi:hypothetical protein